MPRPIASIALAVTISLGSATVTVAAQRTGNPPGPPERPMQPQAATSGQTPGSGMMGQMGEGMMRNPPMQGQMDAMQGCRCCQRMAQMDREPPKRR